MTQNGKQQVENTVLQSKFHLYIHYKNLKKNVFVAMFYLRGFHCQLSIMLNSIP